MASLRRAAYYLALGSAVTILFSIAVSQILLVLSIATLLLSGQKLEFPPLRLPLACFFLVTVAAVLASGDAYHGIPQLRKFFVFAIALAVFSTFRTIRQAETLIAGWAIVGTASALGGVKQFLDRSREAVVINADNYDFIVDGRIKGFESHWMTFGGVEMLVFLILVSWLLFSKQSGWKLFLWPLALAIWAAITLGMTRSIFLLALPLGLAYLLWQRKPWLLATLPVLAAIAILFSPPTVRERIVSVVEPHTEIDSNGQRMMSRLVGWEMIKAHPWLGVGPEQVAKQFDRYVPPTVSRPLPKGWYGHLHNIYLQYAAERGIFGLLCLLWLIGTALRDFLRALRGKDITPEARAILHGAVAVILAVLAEGLFEYNLGDSEVLTIFLATIACGYVAVRDAAIYGLSEPAGLSEEPAVSMVRST